METDQAQCLLLQAGEQILCPRCRAALAVTDVDVHAPASATDLRLLPDGRLGTETPGRVNGLKSAGDRQVFCRSCGTGARSSPGLLILVRSGSWIGWRELGGE